MTWTPYAANHREPPILPYYDGGIYLQVDGAQIWDPAELMLIKNDPNYNEAWPRPVVTYEAIHGIEEPSRSPGCPTTARAPELPAGHAHGLSAPAALYKRESFPGWVDPVETRSTVSTLSTPTENGRAATGASRGGRRQVRRQRDLGVRVLAMEPNTHRSYGPNKGKHFFNIATSACASSARSRCASRTAAAAS